MKTTHWVLLAGTMLMGTAGAAWAADDMKPAMGMDDKAAMPTTAHMGGPKKAAKPKKMMQHGKPMKKETMKPAGMDMQPGQKM